MYGVFPIEIYEEIFSHIRSYDDQLWFLKALSGIFPFEKYKEIFSNIKSYKDQLQFFEILPYFRHKFPQEYRWLQYQAKNNSEEPKHRNALTGYNNTIFPVPVKKLPYQKYIEEENEKFRQFLISHNLPLPKFYSS